MKVQPGDTCSALSPVPGICSPSIGTRMIIHEGLCMTLYSPLYLLLSSQLDKNLLIKALWFSVKRKSQLFLLFLKEVSCLGVSMVLTAACHNLCVILDARFYCPSWERSRHGRSQSKSASLVTMLSSHLIWNH